MRPRLSAIAAEHNGLFTRQQALVVGYTGREIKARTRPSGPWVIVQHGIYCERVLVDALQIRERWLLRDRAALLRAQRPAKLSHDSAARVLRIDTLDVDVPGTHLTYFAPAG